MFNSTRISAVLACAMVFLLLTACGGGGDGGGNSAATVLTGRFVDSAVQGLRFQSATQSGTTNANGEFKYFAGETVTFYIGNFVLGSAVGAEQITPFELAGIPLPVNSVDVTRAINQYYNGNNGFSPLNTAMNLAVFLQTIDQDGYPHDGITIPVALADLLNGKQLDFTQSHWDFEEALSDLIAPVNGTGPGGIWGEYRDVAQADEALTNLYADLAITPTQSTVTRDARDNNNDGVIDYLQLYAYDARGNRIMEARDRDGDAGTRPLSRNYYDYYYYSSNDYPEQRDTGSETDTNGELPGGVTYRERSVYFNTNANYRDVQIYEEDDDGDGPDPLTRRIYDENENTLVEETDANGSAAGGVTRRATNTYNTLGSLVLTLIDADGDGPNSASARTVYTYDINGQQTGQVTDAFSDGPADDTYRATYTYNTSGQVTLHEIDADGAGPGLISFRNRYTYDAGGRQTLFERDANGDTVAGITYYETSQYDSNGRITLREVDANGGTVVAITSRETWAYNASGKETLNTVDNNGDTAAGVTYRRQSTYDTNDRLTQQIIDNDGDGTNAAQITTTNYTYDANGRELTEEHLNSGVITYRERHAYHTANGTQSLYEYEYNPGTPSSYGQRQGYDNSTCWYVRTLNETLGGNGAVISRQRYVLDANCNQLVSESDSDGDGPQPVYRSTGNTLYEIDSNDAAAGGVTYREIYTNNLNGRRVRMDVDADGDGVNGITATTTYTYDANGNQLREDRDSDGAGPGGITYSVVSTYDANGNQLREDRDGDGAGPGGITYSAVSTYRNGGERATYIVDGDGVGSGGTTYSEIRTYDTNGNVTLYEVFDSSQTPNITQRERFTYDSAGNIIREENDTDGNGVFDNVRSYAYTDIPVNWNNVID